MSLKNPNIDDLWNLEIGDEIQFTDDTYALGVPGGWIFTVYRENGTGAMNSSSCFVPFDNELWLAKEFVKQERVEI
jgi:hypothetical protein